MSLSSGDEYVYTPTASLWLREAEVGDVYVLAGRALRTEPEKELSLPPPSMP